MSVYAWIAQNLTKYVDQATLFKYGFNWSPMYARTTGRVSHVSADLHHATVVIPLSWRNANYVGSIFGGSMLSATDPILMVQLLQILGPQYVVWDKAVEMKFKRPGRDTLTATFDWTPQEIKDLTAKVQEQGELEWQKTIKLVDEQDLVCAESTKTMYVATKEYYKQKISKR